MYTVNIGSNDYEGNYLMVPAANRTTPPDKWAAQLITAYSDTLKVRLIHLKASFASLKRFSVSVYALADNYTYMYILEFISRIL